MPKGLTRAMRQATAAASRKKAKNTEKKKRDLSAPAALDNRAEPVRVRRQLGRRDSEEKAIRVANKKAAHIPANVRANAVIEGKTLVSTLKDLQKSHHIEGSKVSPQEYDDIIQKFAEGTSKITSLQIENDSQECDAELMVAIALVNDDANATRTTQPLIKRLGTFPRCMHDNEVVGMCTLTLREKNLSRKDYVELVFAIMRFFYRIIQ